MKTYLKYIILSLLLSFQAKAEIYSVLIGVSDYKFIPDNQDLKYADDDVRNFYSFLTKDLKISPANVYMLVNQQASYSNIIEIVSTAFTKAKKEDLVIFYFSGHGDNGKILPYDFDGRSNSISFAKIAELFRSCKSETKIIFADACRIGGLKPKKNEEVSSVSDKIIAMVSCRANESSIENGYYKGGFFSFFLLNGLRGYADLNNDHKITITELHLYVKKKVNQASQNTQNPITFGNFPLDQVIISY
ncbi:caspase family protein [Emticicia sp. 17c]|uniref:caspase family protein n=1 Tax=Emticicia sp. 17c TaxID=3127704 RepID=UPI00301C658F